MLAGIRQKILQMVENEDANSLLRIVHARQSRLQPLHNRGERVLLDQEKQPLFGFEVVVEAGQRHAAGARKVAHGGAFVSLFAEDFGGVGKDLCEAPVKAGSRRGRAHAMPPSRNSSCGGGARHEQTVWLIRTFVRTQYMAIVIWITSAGAREPALYLC